MPKLDKLFDCPFCNNEKSVSAKLNFDQEVGKVTCGKCGAHYEARITSLSDPIDVYSDWIDACQRVNDEAAPPPPPVVQQQQNLVTAPPDDDDDE